MRHWRIAAFTAGLLLLAWLVERASPARLAGDLRRVGWWMAALVGIAALRNACRARELRLALGDDARAVKFGSLYAVLMVSEAVKYLAAAGVLFGEAAKGWLLARRVAGTRAISAVVVDVVAYYLSAALFCLAGVGLFFAVYSGSAGSRAVGVAGAAAVAAAVVAVVVAVRRRWLTMRRLLAPLVVCRLIPGAALERTGEIDAETLGFRARHPGAFPRILAWDLAANLLSAAEVLLIFRVLGLGAGWPAGIVVEGFTKIVEVGGLAVPGDVGLYQGGTALILQAMGLPPAAGVSVGVIRQVRSILWAGAGIAVLLVPRLTGRTEARPGE